MDPPGITVQQAGGTAGHQFGPQLAVIREKQPRRLVFTPSLRGGLRGSSLGQREKLPLGIQSGSAVPLSYPHLPQCPPLPPSQIKPLTNFCFPNLWTLTEAPTLERARTQHGMISWWQGEAEKTWPQPPDHPVIPLFLLPLSATPSLSPIAYSSIFSPLFPPSSTSSNWVVRDKWILWVCSNSLWWCTALTAY